MNARLGEAVRVMGKGGPKRTWSVRAGSAHMEPIPVSEWPQELLESAGITNVTVAVGTGVLGGAGGSSGIGTVTTQPKDADELAAIASDAADELNLRIGPGATVIVLVAFERDGHSYPAHAWRGTCLSTIGLLDMGVNMVRASMPEEYR